MFCSLDFRKNSLSKFPIAPGIKENEIILIFKALVAFLFEFFIEFLVLFLRQVFFCFLYFCTHLPGNDFSAAF